MKLPTLYQRSTAGMNMTPMIDVVFQLVIFFLLSSHLARQESQLPMDLPAAETGTYPQADTMPRVVVNVQQGGGLQVAGQAIDVERLPEVLSERRKKEGVELQLRIRAHREVEYEHVKPVLMAAVRAGIGNVHFAVVPDEQHP